MTLKQRNTSFHLYKRLLRDYVLRYRQFLFYGAFGMILVAGGTACLAYLVQPALDEIFVKKDETMLVLIPLAIVVVGFFSAIGDFGQMLSLRYVGQRVVSDMQLDLYRHLLNADISLFHDQSSGRLISRLTNDIQLMRQSVSQVFTGLIKETLTMIFLVGLMIHQNWQLSILAAVILVTTILPITRLGKSMRKISDATQVQLGDFTAQLDGTFQGVRVVKAYGREAFEVERARVTLRQLFKLYYRASKVQSASSPIVSFVGSCAIAVVIGYGGYHALQDGSTGGQFMSFITAMMLAARPIKALASINTQLHEGLAAAGRFYTVIDTPPTIRDKANAQPLALTHGEIRFEQAGFAYANGHVAVSNLDFTVPAGSTVALVGASGAGKTTVMNLLLRFYELSTGSITIDGQDIRDITLLSLRNSCAFVSQDVVLFDDSVRANIAYGRLDATEEEITEAARKAFAHDFITQLPQGYDTTVGPMGVKLSGGQRQRISIARAILKNAPILLLDEATSALDTASERAVQAALDGLMQGRTTLVIAHRLSTIQHADKILVLDHGRIIAADTHEGLLATSPDYQQLQHLVSTEPA